MPEVSPKLNQAGDVLFRWRSFTPIPVILLVGWLVAQSRGAPSWGPRWAWLGVGFLLCSLGQTLRAWVLGLARDGTSGQNEVLIAESLSTSGPYRWTRNPLYVGNFLIVFGLALATHALLAAAVATVFVVAQYNVIILAEERFLAGRFGPNYARYRESVPRFFSLRKPPPAGVGAPFRAWRAVRKEHNPAAAWLLGLLAIDAMDRAAIGIEYRWTLVAAVVVVAAWLSVKGWKHRWWSGEFKNDLRRRFRDLQVR